MTEHYYVELKLTVPATSPAQAFKTALAALIDPNTRLIAAYATKLSDYEHHFSHITRNTEITVRRDVDVQQLT